MLFLGRVSLFCSCEYEGEAGDEGKERPKEYKEDSESEREKVGRAKWRREGGSSGVGKAQLRVKEGLKAVR